MRLSAALLVGRTVTSAPKSVTQLIRMELERAHMSVDPEIDWDVWVEKMFRKRVKPGEWLTKALRNSVPFRLSDTEHGILPKFSEDSVPPKLKSHPEAERVIHYVKSGLTVYLIDDVTRYLKKHCPDGEWAVGDHETIDRTRHDLLEHETDMLLHDNQTKQMRHEFNEWIEHRVSHIQAELLQMSLGAFLVFGEAELIDHLASEIGLPVQRVHQILFIQLPKYLRLFSASPEGNRFRSVHTTIDKLQRLDHKIPTLEEVPNA